MVKVNGDEKSIDGMILADYLADCAFDAKRVAVEVNGDIVPRLQYGECILRDGDSVEIVRFVGGG